MGRSVTLLNHKGGVGKTTFTVLLSEALAERNESVLVVDMDPQANATRRLGIAGGELGSAQTLAHCLSVENGPVERGSAVRYIRQSNWGEGHGTGEMIHVLPSHNLLGERGLDASKTGAVMRLKEVLAGVSDQYDWTLVDTPPSLEHLTQMALTATEDALIVASPEHDAVEGAIRARDFIKLYGKYMDGVNILGVVANLVRDRTTLHGTYLTALSDAFSGETRLWEPYIPLRVDIGVTMSNATPPSEGNQEVWEMARLLAKNLTGGSRG